MAGLPIVRDYSSVPDPGTQTSPVSFQTNYSESEAACPSAATEPEQSSTEADGGQFGNCPFCDGYTVEYEHVNEDTGEVTWKSFTRPCRRTRCPVCGETNTPYKASYGQHVASLVQRLDAHPSEVKFLTVSLLKEWADETEIDDWDDSYQVLTGDGGPWSKALRRLRSRDTDLVFAGTISARPSDGRAHAHLVLVTRLSIDQIREAVNYFPLDGHVKTPSPTDSAEGFAANCAEYAFQNHAEAASARFTASRGHGAGYHSKTARELRREAVESKRAGSRGVEGVGDGGVGGVEQGGGVEQTNDVEGGATATNPGTRDGDCASNGGYEGETDVETTARGPPVDLRGERFRTREGAMHAVKHYLSRQVGSAVHVDGLGRADLLQVKGEGSDLQCVVAPTIVDEAVTVDWSEIYARNVPTVGPLDSTSPNPNPSKNMNANDNNCNDQPEPIERLCRARERADSDRMVSRFTYERHNGTREVTEKYADGTTNTFSVN